MLKSKGEKAVSGLFAGVAHAEKYQSGNWVARKLVNNFLEAIVSLVAEAGSTEVHEIGCGEGHILGVLSVAGFVVRGCDISSESLAVANSEFAKRRWNIPLAIKSVYDLEPDIDSSDTIVCCEVLEHLTDPAAAMKKLVSIARKDLIVSVPNEPLWHILNMARGRYLTALGNTPGHFQHWSKKQFTSFVSQYAHVVQIRSPLPWTLIHCRPR